MAALLEKVRDHRLHPVMTQQERDETYGVQTPQYRRRSLPANQRNGNTDAARRRQEHEAMAAVQTDPLEEGQAQKVNTGKIVNIKQRSTTSGQLPQVQQGNFWVAAGKWLFSIAGGLTVLYTVIFLIAFVFVWVGNFVQFGPIHTTYTSATISGQPARIITSNDGGNITVTIKITQKDGSFLIRSYAGPVLNPNVWNGDLGGIVATSQVAGDGQTIIVHLVGEINYFHPFLVRPAQDFSLVPDKQAGYKIST
jgi:hypothetical protein